MMSNIVPFDEMGKMANAVTKSGMFGIKNENQALTLMMIAQAENIAPIQTPTGVPQPMNPVTGNTSPIGGSQQDFDAYMNSYVNDLINQRMKNVFGGIMSSLS